VNHRFLIREADRCVKCGLCLPSCPTYELNREEAESPRGRIALIQGWATGELDADQALVKHLDSCLLCRRCEGACPSDVAFSALMDGARAQLPHTIPAWLPGILANPRRQGAAMRFAAGTAFARAHKWFPFSIVRRMLAVAALLRDSGSRSRGSRGLEGAAVSGDGERGKVALFGGCMGGSADSPALQAAAKLLAACGYRVEIPAAQRCCGAMHAHAGYAQSAAAYRAANLQAFSGRGYEAVVTVSSGCGSFLADIAELDCAVMDAGAFVQQQGGIGELPLARVDRRIAYFLPCSLASMGQQQLIRELLQDLPGADPIELRGKGCCGGAGLQLLTHPGEGERLVEPLIKQLRDSQAESVATTNSGCSLQLQLAARKAGLGIVVVHPLELVAEQLESNDAESLFTLRQVHHAD
jgi:glycolate oxidase iron-sulfur subunit